MPPPDGELMTRLQSGEDHALDLLMDRWQVPLRRFAYRYLQNEADALDVAQETFVRVYRHGAKFRTGTTFSTWMFSIALNLCRDRGRWRQSRPVVLLDEAALGRASDRAAASDSIAPDAELLRLETATAVRVAVDALPEPLKAAVLLCEFEGFSQAEAAVIAGCSVKAVETRLYRARQQLRDALRVQLGSALA